MGFVYLGDSNQDFLTRLSLDEAATSLPSKRIILVLESPHIDEFASCLESKIQCLSVQQMEKLAKTSVTILVHQPEIF